MLLLLLLRLLLQWPDAEESVDENAVEALAGVINTISDA